MTRVFVQVFCCLVLALTISTFPTPAACAPLTEPLMKLFYMPQSGNEDTGPACLDGSPPAIYFRPGTGDGANKWILYHEGGGWCTSIADCKGRSRGGLGSSKSYQPTIGSSSFISTNNKVAPGWYNWNQLYMKYCDGASFSGNRDGTILTEDKTKLYYRGHQNLQAVMQWALDNGLGDATDLIVSGGSAGGLATFLHTAEWCHVYESKQLYQSEKFMLTGNVPGKQRCVAMPDAGFFPDIEFSPQELKLLNALQGGGAGNYGKELRWVYQVQNVTVNHMCQAHFEGEEDKEKCMFAEHTAPFIPQPILVLNSVYDSWQIRNELPNSHGDELVNKLGRLMVDRVTTSVLMVNPKSAAWLTACSEHTVTPHWMTAAVDKVSAPNVAAQWYAELDDAKAKRAWIATDKFPCASCCDSHTEVMFEDSAIE